VFLDLIEQLNQLKSLGAVGIKQSFEDEGVRLEDLILMRRLTDLSEMYLSVKIGGCEAITDINLSTQIGADGIVAPMVESQFALQKYIENVRTLTNTKLYVNIESKQAYNNLDYILSDPSSKLLYGVVVGRSDLTKSYGHGKDYVDSDNMHHIVYDILTKCKEYNMITLMGGNISNKSTSFIKKLFGENLLNYIETRNVIMRLTNENINDLDNLIKTALLFESDWLGFKSEKYKKVADEYANRSKIIRGRLL
jgi:hypothetical protein